MQNLRPILIVAFLMFCLCGQSQNLSDKKNIVQLQIHPIGRSHNGGIIELDYERYLGETNSWSIRLGIKAPCTESLILIPISIQKIFWAQKKNQFEIGVGTGERFELYNGNMYHFRFFPMINLMYRNNISERLHFRLGLTGYITWGSSISPNIGLGYKF